ncbi:hypothetical protein JOB18_041746 [Solea senegalensis]|uniref:Secreted protein n=1 Tax=Solea senegalensis TaxID=28829 RepID=A0AAV6R3G5_SOLSE|nr:hypothetical protein JOB18_041746 [Solea senegalensis]
MSEGLYLVNTALFKLVFLLSPTFSETAVVLTYLTWKWRKRNSSPQSVMKGEHLKRPCSAKHKNTYSFLSILIHFKSNPPNKNKKYLTVPCDSVSTRVHRGK